jgi:hypothetical protein
MKSKQKEINEGAGVLTTKPQFVRKHELADSQTEKGASKAGVVKVADKITEGRHVVVEDGFVSAKRRADEIARARKASEAGICAARSPHHSQNRGMDPGKKKKA